MFTEGSTIAGTKQNSIYKNNSCHTTFVVVVVVVFEKLLHLLYLWHKKNLNAVDTLLSDK